MANLLSIYFIVVTLFFIAMGFVTIYIKIQRPVRFLLIIFLAALIPLITIYYFSTKISTLPETKVPKLVGLSIEQAAPVARAVDLKTKVVQKVFELNVPENQIISQRPEAGRMVKVGRTIDLIVSIGTRRVYMPSLVGRDLSQVEVVIKEAGLTLGNIRKVGSREFPTNTVMSQFPTAGEEVLVGSHVDITVGINPDEEPEEATREAESENEENE